MNPMSRIPVPLVLLLALALGLNGCGGCKQGEPEVVVEVDSNPDGGTLEMPTPPTKVEVPPEVAGTWKAVALEVTDKETRKAEIFTINIGKKAKLGISGLTAEVEAFLPDFTMKGEFFTSKSNELNNPAARVKIIDQNGNQLFYSFLFGLYPATHPFDHPRYGVVLKDYLKN